MQRRVFLKRACTACLLGTVAILSPGMVLTAAAKVKKAYKAVMTAANEVIIPVSLFAEQAMQIVSVKGWDYDMAVCKQEDGSYQVFLLKCTHMDNAVQATGSGFACSIHGSTYDQNGLVTKGPAEAPLEQYHATINEDNLIITP